MHCHSMVVKIIEMIGVSPKNCEAAIQDAVTRASKTVNGITGVDVIGQSGVVKGGRVVEFRAHVKIAFVVED